MPSTVIDHELPTVVAMDNHDSTVEKQNQNMPQLSGSSPSNQTSNGTTTTTAKAVPIKSRIRTGSAGRTPFEKVIDVFMLGVWDSDQNKVAKSLDSAVAFMTSPDARDHIEILHRVGIHAVATGVMNKHLDNAKIQIRGCYLLILLMRLGVELYTSIGIVGGLEAVLNAMNAFPDHAIVQSNACVFLSEYFRECVDLKQFNELGGVVLLTTALAKHPNVEALQHSSCGVIGCMSVLDADTRLAFINCGGIVLVAQSIQTFPQKPELQAVACRTMTILMNSQQGKPLLVDEEQQEPVKDEQVEIEEPETPVSPAADGAAPFSSTQ